MMGVIIPGGVPEPGDQAPEDRGQWAQWGGGGGLGLDLLTLVIFQP